MVAKSVRILGTAMVAFLVGQFPTIHHGAISAADLGIGDPAPAIDVENWIQDGNGRYPPITKFKKGHVYLMEFWATWCAPCIQEMPHLAKLQQKYAKDKFRLISVTDESVDEVKALLSQPYPQLDKSYADVTSAYSLTADPDSSTHRDYMGAAKIQTIPTAFLVGRTGLIEWIGLPSQVDEPLAKVIDGTWNRDAFAKEYELRSWVPQVQSSMAQFGQAGKYDEAIKFIGEQIEKASQQKLSKYENEFRSIRASFQLMAGRGDDETFEYFQQQIKVMKSDPTALIRFGLSLHQVHMDGGTVGPLATNAIDALGKLGEEVKGSQIEALFHYTVAMLHDVNQNLDDVAKSLDDAIAVAKGSQKERFQMARKAVQDAIDNKNEASETKETNDKEASASK